MSLEFVIAKLGKGLSSDRPGVGPPGCQSAQKSNQEHSRTLSGLAQRPAQNAPFMRLRRGRRAEGKGDFPRKLCAEPRFKCNTSIRGK
jgi:hypothetical protein